MASTNPLQRADHQSPVNPDDEGVVHGRRLRTHSRRASRRGKSKAKIASIREEVKESGLPDWEGLKPTATFLIFPALFAFAIVITGGGWDPILMYGIAGLIGLFVGLSTFKGMEIVFACTLFYIPFSKIYTIPIAPMVNGTNIMIVMGIFASIMQAANKRTSWFGWPPGTTLVLMFALFTMFSAVTLLKLPGGYSYLLYSEFLNYKSWVDQFILAFIAICAIRDKQMAKRAWVYMILGSILVVLYTIPEMIDKMGRSSIEKSRLEGPQQQSNNFGGFIAYTTLPLLALFTVYMRDLKAWLITPYFLVFAKILIATFSRGAYLAFAAGALFTGFLKSGRFLLCWALFAISIVVIFPQVLPDAVLARMGAVTQDTASSAAPEKLDRSSEVRLIMWRAASRMTLESPIFGKGFKAFPKLKEDYTEQFVVESDPHSMYLYLASQMGLPALVLFLYIMGFMTYLGYKLSRNRVDKFARAVGIGGASAAACYAIVCIFGSRAVNSDFTLYFWVYFVVMAVLYRDIIQRKATSGELLGTPRRSNAFIAKEQRQKIEAQQAERVIPVEKMAKGKHRRSGKAHGNGVSAQSAANSAANDDQILSPRQQHRANKANRVSKRQSVKKRLGSRRNR